jgi:tRNA pseudouridine38-40 synthase
MRTVQGELELWLARLLGSREIIGVTGAGRTDTGVHASGMVAHFDTDLPVDVTHLTQRLRSALPPDVVVDRITSVQAEFHARYGAIARAYEYRVTTRKSPFDCDRDWYVPGPLDLPAMASAAAAVVGPHDFAGFCIAASRREENTCKVTDSAWERQGDRLMYRVRADRFLHMTVRLLVGTMVEIGRGRWTPERIDEILSIGDVRLCGTSAPPHGLTLVAVEYPEDAHPSGDLG